jgi:hypothetical protein
MQQQQARTRDALRGGAARAAKKLERWQPLALSVKL